MTKLTRRQLVVGGAGTALGAALGGAGIYELVDRLTEDAGLPRRRAAGTEQHVVTLDKVVDNGVEVLVPPLHNEVVTATVRVPETRASLLEARAELENALAKLEGDFAPEPRGLHVTVAWGLPYFDRFVPGPAATHLPVDLRATEAKGKRTLALIDAIRFPSDPEDLVLDANEVAVFFRSHNSDHVRAGSKALFEDLDGLFAPTSIRRGFIGGGFEGGGQSLPKKMAMAAGVAGAELIPDNAQLFLGFTSSQKNTMGPGRIANHETIPGLTDQHPKGYFRGGTAMHLSHIFEDLEAWFLNFDFDERVTTMIRPETRVPPGTQTIAQTEEDAASAEDVKRDAKRHGAFGHSASLQPATRLQEDIVGNDETPYPRGTAIPQRADFDTLDNPFFWSSRPDDDRMSDQPAAGVHFVVFNPTSDDFHRNRFAMDGVLPDGTELPIDPRGRGAGFNAVLNASHRQNFLVPPRRHRSFPLAELL